MDRSIPPATITNISPTALMVTKDTCLTMSLMLLNVIKLGAINVKSNVAASKINKGVYLMAIMPIIPDKFLNDKDLVSIFVSLWSVYIVKTFKSIHLLSKPWQRLPKRLVFDIIDSFTIAIFALHNEGYDIIQSDITDIQDILPDPSF